MAILKNLEASLDKELKVLEGITGKQGAFVRLCGRSPKDGEPLQRHDVWEHYNSKLALFSKENDSIPPELQRTELENKMVNINTKLFVCVYVCTCACTYVCVCVCVY